MNKDLIKEYAHLAIKMGLNVQKNQDVIINSSIETSEFCLLCVEEAYKAGARKVTVNWGSQELGKMRSNYESVETMSEFDGISKAKLEYQLEKLPAMLHIISDDPDGLKGANQAKLAQARAKLFPHQKPYIEKMDEKYQWCIIGYPSLKWAKKCFPNLSDDKALENLLEKILLTARVDGNSINNWQKHNKLLKEKCELLNNLNIDYLHYKNDLGTDFKVWLMEDGLFLGGSEILQNTGVEYNPNMPTEECFTTPIKGKAEGRLYATLPLSYQGELIEDFYLDFKDGKVVGVFAKKNQELLEKMISMDEGAAYLGEVALVPFSSPVNQTKTLFYNTLYDENAVCHFAVGRGFINCVKDFTNYSLEELTAKGVNQSMIHVDFMVGSKDLEIVAHTRDNAHVIVFKNGEWAI